MRSLRRRLKRSDRLLLERRITRQISSQLLFRRRQRWALYIANDGEPSLDHLLQTLLSCGRHVFVPVLHPVHPGRLCFARYQPGQRMHSNRFGIAEPRPPLKTAPLWTFSVICMPLVAFDCRGNRLGMGGGYYDRSFARYRNIATKDGAALLERPLKLGVAFGFQETPAIEAEAWDIPLDAIACDSGYHLIDDRPGRMKASEPR